jgi:hypothetical protein
MRTRKGRAPKLLPDSTRCHDPATAIRSRTSCTSPRASAMVAYLGRHFAAAARPCPSQPSPLAGVVGDHQTLGRAFSSARRKVCASSCRLLGSTCIALFTARCERSSTWRSQRFRREICHLPIISRGDRPCPVISTPWFPLIDRARDGGSAPPEPCAVPPEHVAMQYFSRRKGLAA